MRVDAVHHEGGDGARGVILPRIPSGLQIVQQLLVNVAEVLPLGQIVEIDAGDAVDHLPHQLAGFHVVEGIFEHVPDHSGAVARARCREVLQGWEQVAVDERHQRFARDPFRVRRPIPPLVFCRDGGAIAVVEGFQFLVLIVDNFQEEHPA